MKRRRRRTSEHRSPSFEYLFKYPKRSRFWQYRRPSEKGDFSFGTGEETNEQLANELGERAYHKWLGAELQPKEAGPVKFGPYAREHTDRKLARPDTDFSPNSKRTSRNAIEKHLIPAFGHLRLEQVDEDAWEDYVARSLRENPGQKFFNRRKELNEILRRAHRRGLIRRQPELRNPDPDTEVGQYLEDATVRLLMKHCQSPDTLLLIWIMWKMGPRPGEVLRWTWAMIRWQAGKHGFIDIPGAITKTRRPRSIPFNPLVAKRLKAREKAARRASPYIFPSPKNPGCPMGDYSTGWDGTCRRAGVQADIYDLRRTFITNQAKKGRSIVFVARYVDTSVKMIERFYAKVHTSVLEEIAR